MSRPDEYPLSAADDDRLESGFAGIVPSVEASIAAEAEALRQISRKPTTRELSRDYYDLLVSRAGARATLEQVSTEGNLSDDAVVEMREHKLAVDQAVIEFEQAHPDIARLNVPEEPPTSEE